MLTLHSSANPLTGIHGVVLVLKLDFAVLTEQAERSCLEQIVLRVKHRDHKLGEKALQLFVDIRLVERGFINQLQCPEQILLNFGI